MHKPARALRTSLSATRVAAGYELDEGGERDARGEYAELPLAIRYQALEAALSQAAEDFAERRHLEFQYDLTPDLAKLTVAKRIEDLKAPQQICMPCEAAFCEIEDTGTDKSEDLLFRPTYVPGNTRSCRV